MVGSPSTASEMLSTRQTSVIPPADSARTYHRAPPARSSWQRGESIEWENDGGTWIAGSTTPNVWSFHSLRRVFATWALSQPGARIEDVSRLMGHSTVRVTQDLYISADGDLFERFFIATE